MRSIGEIFGNDEFATVLLSSPTSFPLVGGTPESGREKR